MQIMTILTNLEKKNKNSFLPKMVTAKGHPTIFFCKITFRRSKYCLENSKLEKSLTFLKNCSIRLLNDIQSFPTIETYVLLSEILFFTFSLKIHF